MGLEVRDQGLGGLFVCVGDNRWYLVSPSIWGGRKEGGGLESVWVEEGDFVI